MKKILASILMFTFVLGINRFAFGAGVTAGINTFDDVPKNHWAYAAVAKLDKDGLLNGYRADTFAGDRVLTRYEMAKFIARAMSQSEKASTEDKVLIDKLKVEFMTDLQGLGVRVTALYRKVFKVVPVTMITTSYTNANISNPHGINSEVLDMRKGAYSNVTNPLVENKHSVSINKITVFNLLAFPLNERWNFLLGTQMERNGSCPGVVGGTYSQSNNGYWTIGEIMNLTGRVGDLAVSVGRTGLIHNYGLTFSTEISGMELSYTTPQSQTKKVEVTDQGTKPGSLANLVLLAPGQVKTTLRIGKVDSSIGTSWNLYGMDPEKVATFAPGLSSPSIQEIQFEGSTSKVTHYKAGFIRVSPNSDKYIYTDPANITSGVTAQVCRAHSYTDMGFDTKIGKDFYFLADYSKANYYRNNVTYVLGLNYKFADQKIPGSYSWGIAYNYQEPNATINGGISTWQDRIVGFKGYSFTYYKAIANNTIIDFKYEIKTGITDSSFKDKLFTFETKFFMM